MPDSDPYFTPDPVPRPRASNYDPDTALDLIAQHESGGRNIKQQIVPAGGGYNPSVGKVTGPSTAGGPWQITNTTWNKRAPREITQKYPTAMSAPVEVQRDVARKIFNETGFNDWAPYNASLRQAIARGDQPKTKQSAQDPYFTPDTSTQQPKSSDPYFTPEQPVAATAFNELNQRQPRTPGGIAGIAQREIARTRPKKSILSAATGGMGGGQQGIEVGGKVGQPDQATSTRAGLRGLAQMSGAPTQLLPQGAQDWLNEAAAQGASQLMTTGAGIARQAGPIGSAPARAVGIKAPFDRNQITRDVANQLQGGAQQIQSDVGAAQAQRGTLSRATQNLVAGSIGSAPAMILTSLGVPPAVAFGLQAELQASGRDADFKDIVKETAKGATIGALFSAPLPVKRELLTTLQAALLKAGIVGAGTAAITGSPQEAITNAAFAATGAKGEESPAEPVQTVPDALQAKLRGAEIDQSIAAKEAKVQPTFLRDDAGNPVARVLNPEEVAAGAKPKIRPIHQADTQIRDEVGKFAATEAPTEQPNNTVPQSTPEVQPSTAVSPRQPAEAAQPVSVSPAETTATRPSRELDASQEKKRLTSGLLADTVDADGTYYTNYGEPIKVGDEIKLNFAGGPTGMPRPWKLVEAENVFSSVNGQHNPRITVEAANGKRMTFDNARIYSPSGVRGDEYFSAMLEGKSPASTQSPDKSAATAISPETKPSRLAQGVEAKAIESQLTEGFKDLPEYNTVTVKDQAERAVKLLDDDPELAKQIATGKAEPPQGLHPESVFVALENRAIQNGDVQTIEDLARGPQSVESSIMGQRIRMLGERNPASPVKAIADIEKARSARVPKEKVTQTVNKIKSEVSVEMKQSAPKAGAWAKFLDEVMCR